MDDQQNPGGQPAPEDDQGMQHDSGSGMSGQSSDPTQPPMPDEEGGAKEEGEQAGGESPGSMGSS